MAGLIQRRGRALVHITKTDGAPANPVSLLGGEGQAVLSYLGSSGWDAGGNSLSVDTEVGTSMACVVGCEEV